MAETYHPQTFLDGTEVATEVFELRPDYRVLLMTADGITLSPSDDVSETILRQAEASARTELAKHSVTEISPVAAWREAYKAFGAKLQRTRNSLEALIRRLEGDLPRVNRLTDVYNAISIKHRIPLGREDLYKYSELQRLIRSTGKEDFESICSGQTIIEHPDVGEVVWCNDAAVTCRRWNRRQTQRTTLTDVTTTALFILEVLDPISDKAVAAAADELASALEQFGPDVRIASRGIGAPKGH